MARERMAQLPHGAGSEQRPVGEDPGSGAAPPGSAMEEGQGTLQDRRPTQERERPGRRARRDRQKGGNKTVNTVVTTRRWLVQNHPEATVFLISPLQGYRRDAVHLLLALL